MIKEAALLAAEQRGFDGHGQDGLVGYLRRQAWVEPVAFMGLLGKIMPQQVEIDYNQPVITAIEYVVVDPSNNSEREPIKAIPHRPSLPRRVLDLDPEDVVEIEIVDDDKPAAGNRRRRSN